MINKNPFICPICKNDISEHIFKISESYHIILKYIYENCDNELMIIIERPDELAQELALTSDQFSKCLTYILGKRFITNQRADRFKDPLTYKLEPCGVDFVETVRNKSNTTYRTMVARAKVFQDYYDKPADQMDETHLGKFLHYLLKEKQLKPSSVNTYNVSLRFLYEITLDVAISRRKVPRAKERRRIPELPTKEELLKIFNCAPSLKYKVIFMTIYGSGLRLSEAANLKISDIDSKNMRICLCQALHKLIYKKLKTLFS